MNILGLGDVTHDASVCLMKNESLIAAIELERLTRVKHNFYRDPQFYNIKEEGQHFFELLSKRKRKFREKQLLQGVNYCLEIGNITFDDIDTIVSSTLFSESAFTENTHFIEHHLAHSASAFYPSPFEEAAVLVIDGYGYVGEDNSSVSAEFSQGKNNNITVLESLTGNHDFSEKEKSLGYKNTNIVFSNSLGVFYQNASVLLGMNYNGEGKTMGLASYGRKNKAVASLRNFINFIPNGTLEINNRECFLYISELLNEAMLTLNGDALFQFKADLAYMHQSLLEEMVLHLCRHAYDMTKSKNLCLAGGVALNSVINSEIIKKTPFENVFIQPAASDAGISIGCAFYGAHYLNNISRASLRKNIMFSPFLGKSYKETNEIKKANNKLKSYRYIVEPSMLNKKVAELISEGKIVAWFKNGSEIGPRALGGRCLLADPRQQSTRDYLNAKVKCREWFRPFAPAILEENASEYFNNAITSPYMLFVASARKKACKDIPAAVHINNTSRLQTVSEALTPQFYDIIREFFELTGIPVVLNTSFNRNNEPIVETPANAVDCFLSMPIDALVLEDELFIKS